MDVHIGKVESEIVVSEGVGALAPEEVQRLAKLILEQVQVEQERAAQRERDVAIEDRVIVPGM